MKNNQRFAEKLCGFLGRHFPIVSKQAIAKKNKQVLNDYMQSYQSILAEGNVLLGRGCIATQEESNAFLREAFSKKI